MSFDTDDSLVLAGAEFRLCGDGDIEICIVGDSESDRYAFITDEQAKILRDWLTGRLAKRTPNTTAPEQEAGEVIP